MALSEDVQELYNLVTEPEFLAPQPKPANKLVGELSELKDQLLTSLSGILANYELLEKSFVLKPLADPVISSITVGAELAPLLPTIKRQCDELLETGMPKDNIAENIDNTIGKSRHHAQLLHKFIQDTDQTISDLEKVVKLTKSLFPTIYDSETR